MLRLVSQLPHQSGLHLDLALVNSLGNADLSALAQRAVGTSRTNGWSVMEPQRSRCIAERSSAVLQQQ